MNPKISIVIPIYPMNNWDFFLKRCLNSIYSQTFKDYEIVITLDGKMAENTNSGLRKAKGELVKILYMDDYLSHENSLRNIVEKFNGKWLITACNHDPGGKEHYPSWNDEICLGNNTLGSPSTLTMKKESMLMFDENLSWLLDCDLYQRLYEKNGLPTILNDINVTIGLGEHQATNILSDELKLNEHKYLYEKHSTF